MAQSKLDERIEVIRAKFGLDPSDFWELPQKKGTWVAKHSALEVAAVKADIRFSDPIIIEANTLEGIAVLSVKGSMYERVNDKESRQLREEWATGEASPKNNKNAYPWAMAEKRAKDRVILKLIGIHGLVYSEDEMSGSGVEEPPKQLVRESRSVDKEMRTEVDACANVAELEALWRSKPFQTEFDKLHTTYREGIVELFRERKDYLTKSPARIAPNFDNLTPDEQHAVKLANTP